MQVSQLAPGIFYFKHLLSEQECLDMIHHGERLNTFQSVPPTGSGNKNSLVWCGVNANEVRNNQRIILESTLFSREWSERLYDRIALHLPQDLTFRLRALPEEVNRADVCPNVEKALEWKLCSVSDKFRLYKYEKKQHFLKHFDGTNKRILSQLTSDISDKKEEFVKAQYVEQSFLTMLIYLNSVQDGGETQFFDYYSKKEIFQVKPERGSALVFCHEMLHQGNDVLSGVKYLLRTDVCYMKKKDIVESSRYVNPKTLKDPSRIKEVSNQQQKKQKTRSYASLPEGRYHVGDWQIMYHPSCQLYTD
nr:unnamed protein product [Naegleria fowleri]